MSDEHVIFRYSDQNALDDGVLVDIEGLGVQFLGMSVNRMTGHLHAAMAEFLVTDEPAKELAQTLMTKLQFVEGSPDNTGEVGDIWKLPPRLWLVANEIGGWTVMFPEDY